MSRPIVSDSFRAFYESFNTNIFSLDEMAMLVNRNLPLVADELLLGHLETIFVAPESVYEPRGVYKVIGGYDSPDGFSDEIYQKSYTTAEGGSVKIIANPQRGVRWGEVDKKNIDFLLEVLYICCSRFRLLSLMNVAQKTDTLTGSYNMLGIEEVIGRLCATGEIAEYAAVFSNIKNFKYTNQQVGTQNGDLILKKYSMMIRSFLEEDGYFCRLGGDNFVTIVKKYCLLRYIAFVSDLAIAVENHGKSETVRVAVKAGVYPVEPNAKPDDIISCASIAFGMARRSRDRDIVYFEQEMMERTLHDKRISAMFPDSLSHNEFHVYYQPKVTLADNTLCGCEALTRWHANKVIYPNEFISILEREGTIRNLDFYMLEEVCKDIRSWIDAGVEPVRVSTNFSKIHLSNDHLAEDIIAVLNKYGVDSKYIEIELTELSDFKYFDRLILFVTAMHKNGFHISIDDFGTGYSSMSLIRDVNADVIKLDKSLVDNVAGAQARKADAVIVRSIISMAHELETDVIAEGVETVEQAAFLRANGCRMAQGFLYDRALTREAFSALLAGNRTYAV